MPSTRYSLREQIACVKREIAMRKKVYRDKVWKRTMTQSEADREFTLMEAVLATLEDKEHHHQQNLFAGFPQDHPSEDSPP
ncbi:hypothetical protein [Gloeobacter morelensis]|uniref:hypothetical protein n=1 Tax=Gloeobacter morelensis TaxID=2907343 RepID=UPI001E389815|nr:hypothetical protein [Gloeobacter morelensis]UFP97183.1 hypothetical protein ISF26_23980 [Gloeobacter morelensis MG652769]